MGTDSVQALPRYFMMIDLKQLLKRAAEKNASDIHLKAGNVPHIRVDGELLPVSDAQVVSREETLELARQLLSSRQREILSRKSEVDVSFAVEDLGRYRLAVYQQRGSVSLALRFIPNQIPSVDELTLPQVLKDIASLHRGLILVTGNSGSGKSTTLAAMIRHINETRHCHIITIEDPIEYLFEDGNCLISQREIGADTGAFTSALRAALRQDPDVIMVGEMRDIETVETAMQAAETGHLVMSTLHTKDSIETVNRVISMFPAGKQQDVRTRFAAVLQAAVSMRLVRSSKSRGRFPAVEILRNTEMVRSLILQPERTGDIKRVLAAGGSEYGMQTFDQSIFGHFSNGLITRDDALRHASAPEDLRLRMQGIISSTESI